MSVLEHRLEDFLHAPLAATFFVLAERNDLGPDHLADPATACTLAATALAVLDPWTGDAPTLRASALDAAQPLRPLVREVLTDERNTWWQAPPQQQAQLSLTAQDEARPHPAEITVPTGALERWETYAQKPTGALITSIELPVPEGQPIRSSAHAALAYGLGDWNATYPVRQQRLHVAPDARVAEVHSATDWHDLAASYGELATHPGSDTHLQSSADIDNGPAPTWSALAGDYDGVHLSFAGLLSALYVPVTTAGIGTTTLWAWSWESTYWVRSVFTTITDLTPLPKAPETAGYWQPLD
ncbi:hypothetical protein [Kineococcus aurantiacus]|uniref:hypothetical protein n=1 Tax=Kineococcus aurantiacus TaxID=37633 RepID=UPI0031D17C6E